MASAKAQETKHETKPVNEPKQDLIPIEERGVEYTPLGETKAIRLTIAMVRNVIAVPSARKVYPSDGDLKTFLMLCQSRQLNPWIGDAYLIGYDQYDNNQHVGAKFQLITAVQALDKRAEAHPDFDGMEVGVIIENKNGVIEERQGTMVYAGEMLYGGWCKVYRKGKRIPYYDSCQLTTYSTDKSRWKKDPAGMIAKCARAAALRKAFPTMLAALYIAEEFDHVVEGKVISKTENIETKPMPKSINDLTFDKKENPLAEGEGLTRDPEAVEASIQVNADPETEAVAARVTDPDVFEAFQKRILGAKVTEIPAVRKAIAECEVLSLKDADNLMRMASDRVK